MAFDQRHGMTQGGGSMTLDPARGTGLRQQIGLAPITSLPTRGTGTGSSGMMPGNAPQGGAQFGGGQMQPGGQMPPQPGGGMFPGNGGQMQPAPGRAMPGGTMTPGGQMPPPSYGQFLQRYPGNAPQGGRPMGMAPQPGFALPNLPGMANQFGGQMQPQQVGQNPDLLALMEMLFPRFRGR